MYISAQKMTKFYINSNRFDGMGRSGVEHFDTFVGLEKFKVQFGTRSHKFMSWDTAKLVPKFYL